MKNPLKSLATLCEARPYTVIAVILIVTALFATGIPLIEQDVDMESYLPEDNEALRATKILNDVYGSQSYESVLIRGDVTSLEGMKAIQDLELSILEDPQFEGYVLSVNSYLDYMASAGIITSVLNDTTPTAVQQALAADAASESPQFIGRTVSPDMQYALISVQVEGNYEEGGVSENIVHLMEKVSEFSESDNGLTAGITGDHSASHELMGAMNSDNQFLASGAVIFILIVLFLIFRKISDTLFPYLTIAIAMVWLLGVMGYTGIPFTMALVALMPLLLGICINYAIHIMFRYREERRKGKDVYEGIRACVGNTGTAVFVSALTTVIGFSSFLISELVPMRHFGFLAMVGIFFAFVLVVTLLPALMTIRDRKSQRDASKFAVLGGGVSLFLERVVIAGINHKKPLLGVVALITLVSLGASTQVGTAINWEDMAPDDLETSQVSMEISEIFGNTMSNMIFILIEGDVYSPEVMAEVYELENKIRSIDLTNIDGDPIISSPYSVSTYTDVLIQANGGQLPANKEQARDIAQTLVIDPDTQPVIGRYLVFNPMSKYYNKLSILYVEANVLSDSDIENVVEEIEGFYNEDGDVVYRSAGALVIMSDIMGNMMDTQIMTTIAAMILCFLAVSIIMRSPIYGFLSVLTVALSISWEFLLLYLVGWQFDLFTVMISAMIVGLGIDFSVHIIERFREEMANGKNTNEAIDIVIMNVGKALLTATITTAGAFFIISMSSMPMIFRFGFIAGMVLIFSFLGALFVLPPILAWLHGKKTEAATAS